MKISLLIISACLLFFEKGNAQGKYIGIEYYFRVNVFEIDSCEHLFLMDSAKFKQWFLLNPKLKKIPNISIIGLDKKQDSLRTSKVSSNIFRLYNYNDNFDGFKVGISINHQVIWLPAYLIERTSHLTSVNIYLSSKRKDKGSYSLISFLRTSHVMQERRTYLLKNGKVKKKNNIIHCGLSNIDYIFELENYFWDVVEEGGRQKFICSDKEFEKIINQ